MATIMNNAGPAGTKKVLHQYFQAVVRESNKPKTVPFIVICLGKLMPPKVPRKFVGQSKKNIQVHLPTTIQYQKQIRV